MNPGQPCHVPYYPYLRIQPGSPKLSHLCCPIVGGHTTPTNSNATAVADAEINGLNLTEAKAMAAAIKQLSNLDTWTTQSQAIPDIT